MSAAPFHIAEAHTWQSVLWLSDIHLHPHDPLTFQAWKRCLEQNPADAVWLLGDVFEAWVGDDAADAPTDEGAFWRACAQVLTKCTQRSRVFFMAGNRDFLLTPDRLAHWGVQWVPDPCAIQTLGHTWAICHGDTLCTDDVEYQRFRRLVRSPEWQQQFLSQPLEARLQQVRQMRAASEQRKHTQTTPHWMDVTNAAVQACLTQTQADILIHGHTHLPGFHAVHAGDKECMRCVLPDWQAAAPLPRGHALLTRQRTVNPPSTSPQHVWGQVVFSEVRGLHGSSQQSVSSVS